METEELEIVRPKEAVYMIMREDIRHLLWKWQANVKMIGAYNVSEEVNGLIQKVANLLEEVAEEDYRRNDG